MKMFLEDWFDGFEDYKRRRAIMRGEDLEDTTTLEEEEVHECSLCGDPLTREQLSIHHCS